MTTQPFHNITENCFPNSFQKQADGYSMISEIQAIDMDSWYFNEYGSIRSRDIPNEGALYRLQFARDLVTSIKKTKGIAFDIDRNLSGIEIQPAGNTAKHFYSFIRTAPFPAPASHAVPPEIVMLEELAQTLCLQNYFFTSNPGHLIPDSISVEADLINSFCKHAHNKLSTKGATKQTTIFTEDIEKNIRKISRVFRGIRQQTSKTFCLRFDLTIPNQQGKPSLQDQIFLNLAKKFLEMLREGSNIDTPLALVSKFEVLPGIGRRLHVTAIWNASFEFSPDFVRNQIVETWAQISDKRGCNYFYGFNVANYRGWGVGLDQLEPLERALITLFRRDYLLRLVPQKTFASIVFRELSKPTQQLPFRI